MITIHFKLTDLVDLVERNIELPNLITTLEAVGDRVKLIISFNKILFDITIFINFQSFNDGKLLLKLDAGKTFKLLIPLISKLKLFRHEFVILYNNKVQIKLNELLYAKKLNMKIYSIEKKDDNFSVCIK